MRRGRRRGRQSFVQEVGGMKDIPTPLRRCRRRRLLHCFYYYEATNNDTITTVPTMIM
jgi:hypothetical protein